MARNGMIEVAMETISDDVYPEYMALRKTVSDAMNEWSSKKEDFISNYGSEAFQEIWDQVEYLLLSIDLAIMDLECLLESDAETVSLLPGSYQYYMVHRMRFTKNATRYLGSIDVLMDRPWDKVELDAKG